MSRSGRAAKGFVTALLQYVSQIAVQILLAPLVLKMAGRETLGAYAAIMQTLGLLALVDFAGSWSLERFLAQASGLDDGGVRFRAVFSSARTILLMTNAAFAALVVIFSFFISRLFHLTPNIAIEARYALYVIASWAVIRTPLAAFHNAMIATQDLAAQNLIATLLNVGRTLASLVFVLAGGGLFGLMLSGTIVEAIGSLLYRTRFHRKNPGFKAGWGFEDKALLREMLSFGGYAFFLNIGNRLFLSSANILAGITSGAVATSTFYTTQMPTMTGYNMLYRLTESATPAVHELYGRRDMKRLARAFERLLRLMLLMTFPLALGVALFNRDLVTCWVGLQQYGGNLLTGTLAMYVAVSAVQGIAILFSFVFGWVRLLAISSLLQGAANFGLAYILGKKIGLGGITLALVLVLLPQLVILSRRLDRELGINVGLSVGMSVLRGAVPLACAAAAGLAVHSVVHIARKHYAGFVAEAATFVAVYAIGAYFITMHPEDRADARRYLSRMLHGGRAIQQRVFGVA